MNKKLIKIFIIMTLLVLISGALLHFTYEWSNNNLVVGIFSATNESTWEHLKLAFYPIILFGIISYFFIKDISNNFIEGLTIGILISIIFIIVFFYGYQTILGRNIDFLNILDFVLGIIFGGFAFYKVVNMDNSSTVYTKLLCLFILACLFVCFTVFTFLPPSCELFVSPV